MFERIFGGGFYSHIFHGRIWDTRKEGQTKPRPKASGIHHEGAGMASVVGVSVLDSTRSKKDRRGVYTAVVSITRGCLRKKRHTSFFPSEWTRLQVIEAIREVYKQRPEGYRGFIWSGRSCAGVLIFMLLDKEQKVVTAWPVREYRSEGRRAKDRLRGQLRRRNRDSSTAPAAG